jgi:hypothetical protein
VYTTSTAASSGKLGPFVGLVQQVWHGEAVLMLEVMPELMLPSLQRMTVWCALAQEFPASQPDQYINWVAFGGDLL